MAIVVNILSNVLIRGFGSNICCAGPDRRFTGTAVSARVSTKSRTIKSLFEKSSKVKLGPLGKRALEPPEPALSIIGDVGTASP